VILDRGKRELSVIPDRVKGELSVAPPLRGSWGGVNYTTKETINLTI
jgi:hypothetical protein